MCELDVLLQNTAGLVLRQGEVGNVNLNTAVQTWSLVL